MTETVVLILEEARRLLNERGWRPAGTHPNTSKALSIVEAISEAVRSHVESPGDTQFVIDDAFHEVGVTIRPGHRKSWINLIEFFSIRQDTTAESVQIIFLETIKRLKTSAVAVQAVTT